jgi:hypothetical protein
MFDSSGVFQKTHLPNLQKLYKLYEALRTQTEIIEDRPHIQICARTNNAPLALKRLLLSLRDELLYFAFPVNLISMIIIDDSTAETTLFENYSLCKDSFPWPFTIHYYGPDEKKEIINDYCERTNQPSEERFSISAHYNSTQIPNLENQGINGTLNSMMRAARRHADEKTWTLILDQESSFGTYVKVNKGHFEHQHAFSYFHRLMRVIAHGSAHSPIDVLLGSSVGDHKELTLTWKVVHNLVEHILSASDNTRVEHLVSSFLTHFPSYDLVLNNAHYTHRPLQLEFLSAKKEKETISIRNNDQAILFSPRFIKENPYTFFISHTELHSRFLPLVKNDPRFVVMQETSLALSRARSARIPLDAFPDMLQMEIEEEYKALGFHYALYFCTNDLKLSLDAIESFLFKHGTPQTIATIKASLNRELPFPLKDQRERLQQYITTHKEYSFLLIKFSKSYFSDRRGLPVMKALESAIRIIHEFQSALHPHILAGIDMFFATLETLAQSNKTFSLTDTVITA